MFFWVTFVVCAVWFYGWALPDAFGQHLETVRNALRMIKGKERF